MKMVLNIDLDEEIIDYESIGESIKRVIQEEVEKEIRKAILGDKKFHNLVEQIKDEAINKAIKARSSK